MLISYRYIFFPKSNYSDQQSVHKLRLYKETSNITVLYILTLDIFPIRSSVPLMILSQSQILIASAKALNGSENCGTSIP
jgi:hypothetical protein